MAGHSHWAGIKHKKALVDAKRGKVWSRMSKAIIIAAKMGGGDPDANFRLRTAVEDAKAVSMPKDNITRAMKKGTGELDGGNIEEIVYEGYGPGGVAVLCEVLTDNRNRTAPEVRKTFEIAGGKLGSTGCVAWNFDKKGLFLISADKTDEDTLMEVVLEAGADDVKQVGDKFEVTCAMADYQAVSGALAAAEIETDVAELSLIPKDTVDLDASTARKVLKLMEKLDDLDDVQAVSANFNIPEDVMAQIGEE
jgi:YebC/PmpR family DNA-binding regulatory protein